MLPSRTVLKTPTERRTNQYTSRELVRKGLASELALAPGQTEPVMWCLADITILNSHTNLEVKSWGQCNKGDDCRY